MLIAKVVCTRKENYDPLKTGNEATALDFSVTKSPHDWADDQVGPALSVNMTTSPEGAAGYVVGEEYVLTIE